MKYMAYAELSDEELLELIKKGNHGAWEFLIDQYHSPLYHYVIRFIRNHEVTEELLQDVFLIFWKKKDTIFINISLKAYLFRAARNHALNFLKRDQFEKKYQQTLEIQLTELHNQTEELIDYNELEQAIARAIESLPEPCKEIFRLSRFEGLTYKEIAEMLDIPVRTVHYQIGLALKELRTQLKPFHIQDYLCISLLLFTKCFWFCEATSMFF
jgi:RNA polymerase sigma-70 factor (ECF subfamily)